MLKQLCPFVVSMRTKVNRMLTIVYDEIDNAGDMNVVIGFRDGKAYQLCQKSLPKKIFYFTFPGNKKKHIPAT